MNKELLLYPNQETLEVKETYSHSSIEGRCNGNYKHGLRNTKLYSVFNNIKQRCYCGSHHAYSYYGKRGIKVCPEWKDDFKAFYDWSMAHGYREGLTIDRIDNNASYSPDNCRWVSMKVQSNNRRSNHIITYNGQSKTIAEWSSIKGINYYTLRDRINKLHWSPERALETVNEN